MSGVVELPVSTSCSGRTSTEDVSTAAGRDAAILNFYAAERRAGTDPDTAWSRSQAFAADLDRVRQIMAEG